MSKFETKVLHTIGFHLVKIFPQPMQVSIACVTEDCYEDGTHDTFTHFSRHPYHRIGHDGSNWDWSNDGLYKNPNSFRYLKYK